MRGSAYLRCLDNTLINLLTGYILRMKQCTVQDPLCEAEVKAETPNDRHHIDTIKAPDVSATSTPIGIELHFGKRATIIELCSAYATLVYNCICMITRVVHQ